MADVLSSDDPPPFFSPSLYVAFRVLSVDSQSGIAFGRRASGSGSWTDVRTTGLSKTDFIFQTETITFVRLFFFFFFSLFVSPLAPPVFFFFFFCSSLFDLGVPSKRGRGECRHFYYLPTHIPSAFFFFSNHTRRNNEKRKINFLNAVERRNVKETSQ